MSMKNFIFSKELKMVAKNFGSTIWGKSSV